MSVSITPEKWDCFFGTHGNAHAIPVITPYLSLVSGEFPGDVRLFGDPNHYQKLCQTGRRQQHHVNFTKTE